MEPFGVIGFPRPAGNWMADVAKTHGTAWDRLMFGSGTQADLDAVRAALVMLLMRGEIDQQTADRRALQANFAYRHRRAARADRRRLL